MAFKLLLFVVIALTPTFAYSSNNEITKSNRSYIPILNSVLRIFSLNQRCLSRGFFECLRLKLFRAIDRAVKTTDVLEVTSGVHFVRNPDVVVHNGTHPRALLDGTTSVGSFLMEKLREFLQTHLLQVKRNRHDIITC